MSIIKPSRRRFLLGAATLIATPAIVKASNLMPVKVFREYNPPVRHGFIPCDGRLIPKNVYPELYEILKGVYGETTTHFAIPDLRYSANEVQQNGIIRVQSVIITEKGQNKNLPVGAIVPILEQKLEK